MKTIILLLLVSGSALAEVDVKIYQNSRLADDDTYMTGRWTGVQASYGKEDYVFLAHERVAVIPLWGIGDLSLTGIGIGTRQKLSNRFSFFVQAGYFFVSHENEGRHPAYADGWEGISYYMNNRYGFLDYNAPHHFDEFQIEYEDTYAIEIGGEYKYPLSEDWSLNAALSYRYMRLEEFFRVYRDEWNFEKTGACWEQAVTRDYSSINAGLSVRYDF